MSAALVESVRDTVDAETMQTLEIALYKLDLPAILAALAEAEALRAQVVAAQGLVARFREACLSDYGDGITKCELCAGSNIDRSAEGRRFATVQHDETCPCVAPRGTAALRALLEQAWDGGWDAGLVGGPNATRVDIDKERGIDVDRVLGGS